MNESSGVSTLHTSTNIFSLLFFCVANVMWRSMCACSLHRLQSTAFSTTFFLRSLEKNWLKYCTWFRCNIFSLQYLRFVAKSGQIESNKLFSFFSLRGIQLQELLQIFYFGIEPNSEFPNLQKYEGATNCDSVRWWKWEQIFCVKCHLISNTFPSPDNAISFAVDFFVICGKWKTS